MNENDKVWTLQKNLKFWMVWNRPKIAKKKTVWKKFQMVLNRSREFVANSGYRQFEPNGPQF
jgi:hypothetical protein